MLYIFESAFDEAESVSRETREKLSGLETVLKSTAESLEALENRLEQPVSRSFADRPEHGLSDAR